MDTIFTTNLVTTKSGTIQLCDIEVNPVYLEEWNERATSDFKVLAKDDAILRNTLYRIGGMSSGEVGETKYCTLLKYTEALYDTSFIKKIYPQLNSEQVKKKRKHLAYTQTIIDKHGNEVATADEHKYLYLVDGNSCIYSMDKVYYNIETGFRYGSTSNSMSSDDFLFIDNAFDKDVKMRGIIKINKWDGTWDIFTKK